MSKRKGTQGAKGVETKLREEEVVECSTSAASGECQEGSQHESEEGPEVRARKRWADVESDDEEEHFPGFGDLNSTNATTGKQQETETETNPKHTEESGDGKESVDKPAEEEWQEVTKKTKQSKPVQEDPVRSVRRDRGRGGGDRRRKDGNGKDGKDGKDDKEKKEGQARRRDPKSGAQGDEKGARRRGEQEKNGERKDQGKARSEKKDVPKETWRKKNGEEDVQADKPKAEGAPAGAMEKKEVPKREGNEAPKNADGKGNERKTEKRDSGRNHERQRKEPKENDSMQDGAPKASRQNSGRTDGRRERGGRRPGGGNGSQRASGPTAEDWFASRMQTAC